jgi:hypothetical protein
MLKTGIRRPLKIIRGDHTRFKEMGLGKESRGSLRCQRFLRNVKGGPENVVRVPIGRDEAGIE